MDLDPLTNILTLDSQDTWDFQTFQATINNIVFDAGEVITGLVFLGGDITYNGVTPLLSFTDTSISIFYNYMPGVF